MIRRPPSSPLFPSPPLFRAGRGAWRRPRRLSVGLSHEWTASLAGAAPRRSQRGGQDPPRLPPGPRSEEHTSELQSRQYLVCRLLLEKKKKQAKHTTTTS